MTIQSPEELLELFLEEQSTNSDYIAPESYKYVIYVRKSQESQERQVRSLGDQVAECNALAKGKFKIVDIIQESESAKEPGIRPKFNKMLEDFRKGKYDGIIAWHPDRLARNMKEGGEIIDMIDKGIIKDLKFVSYTFTNDTSGKMLLGMAFVFSKQYSDKLSDDVTRGNLRSLGDGKFLNKGKHGYVKDRNLLLRADGESFMLLKKAWDMRLDSKNLEQIAQFLNDNNYTVKYSDKHERKIFTVDKKFLSNFFKDPLYCGVLHYGDEFVNLNEKYDFVPMVSAETYCKVNKISTRTFNARRTEKQSIRANLLRGQVFCGYCEEPFVSGLTKKKNADSITEYYYYRCDNDSCSQLNKSVRAHVVTNFVYDFLDTHSIATEEIYKIYKEQSSILIKDKIAEQDSRAKSLNTKLNSNEESIKNTKSLLTTMINKADSGDHIIIQDLEDDLKKQLALKHQLKQEIDDVHEVKKQIKTVILDLAKYLELSAELPSRIRKIETMESLDKIIGNIFLNFYIKDKKVTSYQLKEPFASLFKASISKKSSMVGPVGLEPTTN